MSALVDVGNNTGRQLDRKAQPDEQVTEADVASPAKLARLLTRILADITAIRRKFVRRNVTFTNLAVDATGTVKYRLPHRFRGAVDWFVVGWRNAVGGPDLVEHEDTDENTLVLVSNEVGTATIRVEERG